MDGDRNTQTDARRRRILTTLFILLAFATWPVGRAAGGINVWTRHGPKGANVRALAVAPGSPTRLLAAMVSAASAPSGSLWASRDAAASWYECADLGDFDYVNALVFDPSNPEVAYAATSAVGVMKSTDGGNHWTLPPLTWAPYSVAVAPSKTTTIYAGSDGWVLRSDDGGGSWRGSSAGLPARATVGTIAVQPDSEATVYVGTGGNGVFKSTDGGATWAAASAGLPNAESAIISLLAFDHHRPANLLAVVGETRNDPGGLYRSSDGGANWVAVFRHPATIALSPRDPSLIYLAGGDTLYKSADDGASWATLLVVAGTNVRIDALAADPEDAECLYAGITGGDGVLKSTDGGVNWTPSGLGLINTGVKVLALGPGSGASLYALGDDIGLVTSPDQGESWTSLGDSPFCYFPSAMVVDPANPNTLYAGCEGNGVFKSSDSGRSWARTTDGFDAVVKAVYALAIDPRNSRTLYAGSKRLSDWGRFWGNLLYKTINGGVSWEVLSAGLPTGSASITALAVDPRSPATVYAGGQSLWRSVNGGHSWSVLPAGAGPYSAIVVDPHHSGTVFCAKGEVAKTTDGGATWTSSSPPSGARTLILDPVEPSTLYAGGICGASMSVDGGTTWTLVNGGLANVRVTALAIDATGTRLHAATDGGGVFDLEFSTTAPEISVGPDAVTITAGTSTVLTATIDPPQLTDTRLAAVSSNPEVASLPSDVTVPAGETSVSFMLTGGASAGAAVISVRLPDALGGAAATVDVTVTAIPRHVHRRPLHGTVP